MKKFFLIIIVFFTSIFFLSCESNDNPIVQGTSNLKPNSKILIEYFTNITCVNCPQVSHYLVNIDSLTGTTINDTNVVILAVHSYLNTIDPFYQFNSADNTARTDYYSAGLYNPINFIMGTLMPSFNSSSWTNIINQRLSQKNTFVVNTTNVYDSTTKSGTLNITVGQLSGVEVEDLKMHVAITESNILFNAPNGEKIHHNILRKLATPSEGESIHIEPGQSDTFIQNYTVPNGVNQKNCKIIIFVQSQSSKVVFGVDKLKIM